MSGLFTSEVFTFGSLTVTRRLVPGGYEFYVDGERVHLEDSTLAHLWGILKRVAG